MTLKDTSEMTDEEVIQRFNDIKAKLGNLSFDEIKKIQLDPFSIEILLRIKFGMISLEKQALEEELVLCVEMEKVGLDAGNREHRSIYEESIKKN